MLRLTGSRGPQSSAFVPTLEARRQRVLIVQGDPSSDTGLMTLCRELYRDGFDIDVTGTVAQGLSRIAVEAPVLVLIHSLQRQSSWIDMCVEIRKMTDLPVVLGFAPPSLADVVLAFELGVVGYVNDASRTRELLARIRSALALVSPPSQGELHSLPAGTYVAGDIRIDMDLHQVTVRNEQVHLARLEFDLLALLLNPPDQVHTRTEIMSRVWAGRPNTNSRTLDTHIRWLRQKLEDDPTNPRHLITVWGVGFRFEAVREEVVAVAG